MKMKQAETYLIREFARMAGVTVRTLHYYDRVGLLKPSLLTPASHRLYKLEDLLRLQQILTLKAMGFTLDEIRQLLENPAYDLRTSLRIQKEAIDQRIEQLQQVSRALEQTLATLSSLDTEEVDWHLVCAIIRAMVMEQKQEWAQRYYTAEQWKWLQERAKQVTPLQLVQWEQEWMELIAAFQSRREQAPDDPEVQRLAGKMLDLINIFTEGDEGIVHALKRMYSDREHMPEQLKIYDGELHNFMNKAMVIYQQRNGNRG